MKEYQLRSELFNKKPCPELEVLIGEERGFQKAVSSECFYPLPITLVKVERMERIEVIGQQNLIALGRFKYLNTS